MIGSLLGRKIEKLKHRGADHPLITNQCLDDVGVRVARARDQFSSAVFFVEELSQLSHPLIVTFDCPIVFVQQLNAVEPSVLEREHRLLEARMHQPFHRPDLAAFFFLTRNDFGFGALEHRFHAGHRIIPAETKRREQIVSRAHRKCGQKKSDKRKGQMAHHN